ncbi:MAG: ATP-dependent DNA helicase RecG [Candidatus Zixiibacteriota bacterium]
MLERLEQIPGIGPKRAKTLREIGIKDIRSLLAFFPNRYIFRDSISEVEGAKDGDNITLLGTVEGAKYIRPRRLLKIEFTDTASNPFSIFLYGPRGRINAFPVDKQYLIWGKIQNGNGDYYFIHPQLEAIGQEDEITSIDDTFKYFPVYPMRQKLRENNLSERVLHKCIKYAAKANLKFYKDPLPEEIRKRNDLIELSHAIWHLHFPDNREDIEKARRRFAFTELFERQSIFELRRRLSQRVDSPVIQPGEKYEAFQSMLGFELTNAQKLAWMDILRNIASGNRMTRLLQGDVGSGKTILAMLAAVAAIDSGLQVAFIIPSTVLSYQHFKNFEKAMEKLDIPIALLTGKTKPRRREHFLRNIKTGYYKLVIGTQALLSDKVVFKDLGLVIIDEQHKFGVSQRMRLLEKQTTAHFIMMSATPIPRTCALADYGDLDITSVKALPNHQAGRRTFLRNKNARENVYDFIEDKINKNQRAFVVYPIIEDSEKMSVESAKKGYENLCKKFGKDNVAFLHGRMPEERKVKTFQAFSDGKFKILAATSVIEVGIDIPEATVMLIEDADFFGLSQLHQLRGRIGRGKKEGYCILITRAKPESESFERLKMFAETEDGFEISEIDLELRGEGELLGRTQSGVNFLRYAKWHGEENMLEITTEEAKKLFEKDSNELRIWMKYIIKNYGLPDGEGNPFEKNTPEAAL